MKPRLTKISATFAALAVFCLARAGVFAADLLPLPKGVCNGLDPIAFIDRTADYDSTQKDMRSIGPAVIRCKFDGDKSVFDASKFKYSYQGIDGTEYTKSEEAPLYAGKYEVTVTVENDTYIGTAQAFLTIHPKSLASADFVLTIPAKVYNGEDQCAPFPQANNSRPKFLPKDIDVSCDDAENAGTVTVTMVGRGNYYTSNFVGPVVRTFTINKKPITIDTTLCRVENREYDGTMDVQVAEVGFKGLADVAEGVGSTLEGYNYTVTSAQFRSADVADTGTIANVTIKLEPAGPRSKNYTLSGSSSFRARGYITRAEPSINLFDWDPVRDIPTSHTAGYATGVPMPAFKPGAPVTGLGTRTVTYNGSAAVPQVAGPYQLYLRIAAGKNYLAAELDLGTYTILDAVGPTIITHPMNATARLGGTAPPLTVDAVSPNGGTLSYQWYRGSTSIPGASGSSYTPNISELAVGTYTYNVVVTNTKGTQPQKTATSNPATYTVLPEAKPIDDAVITITVPTGGYVYTGSAITPTFSVKLGNTTLTAGTDYTSAPQNSINVGTATLIVTGRDAYKGTVSATFAIVKRTITASDLVIRNVVVYNGGQQPMPVEFRSGIAGAGVITLTYNGLALAPADVGTYNNVVMNVSEGVNFRGLVNYSLGSYQITQKEPEASDLIYGIPPDHVYTGFPFGMGIGTVTARGSGAGTLTVYYNGKTGAPMDEGDYVVTVNVAGGKNYTSALVQLGVYTIHPAGWVAVREGGREIPVGSGVDEAAIAPVAVKAGAFTVGPSPVKSGSEVTFFYTGKPVVGGMIRIYGASGDIVKEIAVTGKSGKIAVWMADVPEGVYLARGVLMMRDGKRVKVSFLFAVR